MEVGAPMLIAAGYYAGRYRLRTGGGKTYVHIPVELVEELKSRKVRVTAVVSALGCNNVLLHSSLLSFTATLVEVGGTYRLNIPSRYASLKEIADCGVIDVWLSPIAERPAR
jgi:hypothetical protein